MDGGVPEVEAFTNKTVSCRINANDLLLCYLQIRESREEAGVVLALLSQLSQPTASVSNL